MSDPISLAHSRSRTMALSVVAAAAVLACLSNAQAQVPWPTREVRLIAPFAAGSGGTDAVARLMAEKLRGEIVTASGIKLD